MIFRRMRGLKDNALAKSLKSILNERFSDVGEVIDCELDTAAGSMVLTLNLPGEVDEVILSLERYTLSAEDGKHYVVIDSLSCTREWVGRLLNRLLAGKRYKIPAAVSALL